MSLYRVIERATVNVAAIHHSHNVFLASQITITLNTLLDHLHCMLHFLTAALIVKGRENLELRLEINTFLRQWYLGTLQLKALTLTPSKDNEVFPLL